MYYHAMMKGTNGIASKGRTLVRSHIVVTERGLSFDRRLRAVCGSRPSESSDGWAEVPNEHVCEDCAGTFVRVYKKDPFSFAPLTEAEFRSRAEKYKKKQERKLSRRQEALLRKTGEENPCHVTEGKFRQTVEALMSRELVKVSWTLELTKKGREVLANLGHPNE